MLLKLVNDILDFTKLEAGQMTFRAEPVDASELGRSCLRMFEGQALGKGLQLRMVDDLPAGARLELDPDRMRQVLLNLLSNAVKFTERGSVTLRMALDATKRTLRIDVCDTGRGIPADRQAGVFDRFSQAHQEERRYGGTGLGLAICRSIVEGVGGTISVASEVGSGSRFTVTIPIRSTSVEPASTQGSGSGKISVLVATGVADDGKRVQDLLEGRLDLSIAMDEEDAVRLADAQPYDVLLFGLEMRGAGAAETLKRIRAGTGPNKDTPALALDADAATNGEALRALGFASGVVKPVTAADLMSTLAATLMQARVGP